MHNVIPMDAEDKIIVPDACKLANDRLAYVGRTKAFEVMIRKRYTLQTTVIKWLAHLTFPSAKVFFHAATEFQQNETGMDMLTRWQTLTMHTRSSRVYPTREEIEHEKPSIDEDQRRVLLTLPRSAITFHIDVLCPKDRKTIVWSHTCTAVDLDAEQQREAKEAETKRKQDGSPLAFRAEIDATIANIACQCTNEATLDFALQSFDRLRLPELKRKPLRMKSQEEFVAMYNRATMIPPDHLARDIENDCIQWIWVRLTHTDARVLVESSKYMFQLPVERIGKQTTLGKWDTLFDGLVLEQIQPHTMIKIWGRSFFVAASDTMYHFRREPTTDEFRRTVKRETQPIIA